MLISPICLTKNIDYARCSSPSASKINFRGQIQKDCFECTNKVHNNTNKAKNLSEIFEEIFSTEHDLQLYRCIGEGELEALMENETIDCAYSTSDPRGWGACDWHSGFTNIDNKKNYFVTFKKFKDGNRITDRRDNEKDTRYLVKSYNLSDVENIREGYNTHGRLVYSQNFEEAQKLDKLCKRQEIKELINDLKNIQTENYATAAEQRNSYTQGQKAERINEIYNILGSYAEEFPEIVDELKPLSEGNNQTKKLLLKVIECAHRQKDLPFVRKTLREFANDDFPIDSTYLIWEYGIKDDVPLLLDIAKSDVNKVLVGFTLAKIADKEDYPTIKETYFSGTPRTQNSLISYFKNIKDKEKSAEIARATLDMYKNSQNSMIFATKLECCEILEKHGTINDIPLLEKYDDIDAKYAIKEIKKRFDNNTKLEQ